MTLPLEYLELEGGWGPGYQYTVNSRLVDTPLLRTLAITDKIQIPIYRGLTENDSRYYGLSLFRTQNDVPEVSAITKVDCNYHKLNWSLLVRISSRHECLNSLSSPHPGATISQESPPPLPWGWCVGSSGIVQSTRISVIHRTTPSS